MKKKKYRLGPHWYLTTIQECPVCGRQTSEKVRVYGIKPSEPSQRIIYKQQYDYCMES